MTESQKNILSIILLVGIFFGLSSGVKKKKVRREKAEEEFNRLFKDENEEE